MPAGDALHQAFFIAYAAGLEPPKAQGLGLPVAFRLIHQDRTTGEPAAGAPMTGLRTVWTGRPLMAAGEATGQGRSPGACHRLAPFIATRGGASVPFVLP